MLRRPEVSPDLVPNLQFSPGMVVVFQLDALQNNDLYPLNTGIRVVWNFASPANRALIGPIDQFVQVMKSSLYQGLIGFEAAELGGSSAHNERVQHGVRLYHHRRGSFAYVFMLSRQDRDPYLGCWMTDAIVPLR
jgi:hypothetical protein